MNAVGVIPARYGSTRLPGKPLADLGGKPVIQHVYERALMADSLGLVIVATDDRRIAEAVAAFGGKAVMTSPDHPNGSSRAAEAAERIDAKIVVNIQGDEPFLDATMIDEVVEALESDPDVPSATLCCRIPPDRYDDPNVVKTVCDQNGFALYFSRSIIPYPRHAEFQVVYEHIGIYGYRRWFLPVLVGLPETPLAQTESLEQLTVLEHGYRMKVVETGVAYDALSIDTEEDLLAAQRILSEKTDGR